MIDLDPPGGQDSLFLRPSIRSVAPKTEPEPKYVIHAQNVEIELPAGEITVYLDMPHGWHNGDDGLCTLSFDKIGDSPVTVTIGETTVTDYYVQIKIPVSITTGMTPLKVTLSAAAKCKLGW